MAVKGFSLGGAKETVVSNISTTARFPVERADNEKRPPMTREERDVWDTDDPVPTPAAPPLQFRRHRPHYAPNSKRNLRRSGRWWLRPHSFARRYRRCALPSKRSLRSGKPAVLPCAEHHRLDMRPPIDLEAWTRPKALAPDPAAARRGEGSQ